MVVRDGRSWELFTLIYRNDNRFTHRSKPPRGIPYKYTYLYAKSCKLQKERWGASEGEEPSCVTPALPTVPEWLKERHYTGVLL